MTPINRIFPVSLGKKSFTFFFFLSRMIEILLQTKGKENSLAFDKVIEEIIHGMEMIDAALSV